MTRQSLEHEIACIQAAFAPDSPISPEQRADVIRNALVRTYIRSAHDHYGTIPPECRYWDIYDKAVCLTFGADPRFTIP